MRKILILFSMLLLQSCIGGFSKLEFASLENVRINTISLTSTRFVASANIVNNGGRELEIRGLEIYSDQLEGVSLSIDSTVFIPCGTNLLYIPAELTYNPISLIGLLGKADDTITLRFVIKLPGRSVKLKKKVKATELLTFVNTIKNKK